MTGRRDRKPSDGELDPSLDQLLDDLIERLQAGEEVDLEAVIREHPEHAEPIRRMVPALEALVDFGESSAPGDGRRPGPGVGGGDSGQESWAISGSCGRSAGAAWGSSTRPSRSRSAAGWR